MKKIILVLLLYIVYYVAAEATSCCPDDEMMMPNTHCPGLNTSWIKVCTAGAYIITEDEFTVAEDGSLLLQTVTVPKERYCVGRFADDNETVAMICFKAENNSGKIGRLFCCGISIICVAVTLIIYLMLPNLRDIQGKCMMFAIFSLMMGFLFLSVVQTNYFEYSTCVALASQIQFWFLSTFVWLNIVSFNVWRTTVCPQLLANKKFLFVLYNIYGWGVPIVIEVATLIAHHVEGDHINPHFGKERCWFSGRESLWAYFYGPITVLIIVNIVMFISAAISLWKNVKRCSDSKLRSKKFKCTLYLRLFIIMGVCWIFEPMSELLAHEDNYIWVITDYVNALQGLLIFLLLIVFRKRVRRDLARKGLCCNKLPKEWQTMPNDDCEELEEDVEDMPSTQENAANPS